MATKKRKNGRSRRKSSCKTAQPNINSSGDNNINSSLVKLCPHVDPPPEQSDSRSLEAHLEAPNLFEWRSLLWGYRIPTQIMYILIWTVGEDDVSFSQRFLMIYRRVIHYIRRVVQYIQSTFSFSDRWTCVENERRTMDQTAVL